MVNLVGVKAVAKMNPSIRWRSGFQIDIESVQTVGIVCRSRCGASRLKRAGAEHREKHPENARFISIVDGSTGNFARFSRLQEYRAGQKHI